MKKNARARALLPVSLALGFMGPAAALDRLLPQARIKDNGDVTLSSDLRIGSFLGGKYVATPSGILMTDTSTPVVGQIPISLFRPNYTAFNNEGAGLAIQYGNSTAARARAVGGALPQFDAFSSMVTNSGPTNAVGQVSALSGNIRGRVQNKTKGNNGYSVAVFGNATCEVNDCVSWGGNFVVNDGDPALNGNETNVSGRVVEVLELDVNKYYDSTTVLGINMILNGLTPNVSSSFAIVVDKNSGSPAWAQGFTTGVAATRIAVSIGQMEKSAPYVASQPINFRFFDGNSSDQAASLALVSSAANGNLLTLSGNTGGFFAPNYQLPSGGIIQFRNAGGGTPISALYTDGTNRLNLGLNANGMLAWSNLMPSTAGAYSVGTPSSPFGVIAANAFYAGATAGVTCSGAPTSAFASSGGIVTHC